MFVIQSSSVDDQFVQINNLKKQKQKQKQKKKKKEKERQKEKEASLVVLLLPGSDPIHVPLLCLRHGRETPPQHDLPPPRRLPAPHIAPLFRPEINK